MVYTARNKQISRAAKKQQRRVAGWQRWMSETKAQRVKSTGEIQIAAGRRTRRRGSSLMQENV